jgi:phospholipase/lecithinase/hemolysin
MRSVASRGGLGAVAAVVLLLVLPVAAGAAGLPARPSEIIVFGDSLSDTGNAHIATLHSHAPSPPYYDGRFSNGPVWVEYFAAHFGLTARPALAGGTNFAVGGAKAGSSADRLPYQADLYLLLSALSRSDPNALYVVFGGGNDIRSALKLRDAAPALAHAALSIRQMIEHLAAHGAVNFLVPNVPNRGLTPAARTRGTQAREEQLTRAFDAGLDAALAGLDGARGIHLVRVDFWSAVERAFAAPEPLGFRNTRDPCLRHEGSDYHACAEPDHYVFWDDIHPTMRGHMFLSAAALAAYAGAAAAPAATSGAAHRPGDDGDAVEETVLRAVEAQLQPALPAPRGG